LLAELKLKELGLGISAVDSVFKAIVFDKTLHALPAELGYHIEGQRHMLQRVLQRVLTADALSPIINVLAEVA